MHHRERLISQLSLVSLDAVLLSFAFSIFLENYFLPILKKLIKGQYPHNILKVFLTITP